MRLSGPRTSHRENAFKPLTWFFIVVCLGASGALLPAPNAYAQTVVAEANGIRIGERLTYSVSLGKIPNMAYAEIYAVSRGRLGDKDAIEVRTKFKTLDLASATFHLVDETRTTFVSPATGSPLHVTVNQNAFGLPREIVTSFLTAPTPHFDLSTMIYRIRQSGGTGSLTLIENEKVYPVTFQTGAIEKVKVDAGEFETTVVSLQSDYFTELGLTNVRVNLSNDESRLPVLVRLHSTKGTLRAALASIQIIEPEVVVQPTPTPARTPQPERTPKPVATPTPYVDNLPLPPELAFDLGEDLQYRILAGGQPVATMHLLAKERINFNGFDSLVLEANFSDVRPGSPFAGGDFIRAHVDPETLSPRRVEIKFNGELRAYSGTAVFDRQGSSINFGGSAPAEAPVGTHSILSLLYATRSFNLKPSPDLNNPINDTRVAVFWQTRSYVFTLRPAPAEVITVDGKQVAAQRVTVGTQNQTLDQQQIKIWLGNDDSRIPLRFSVGTFTADLVAVSRTQPK
jgi:hypothetical protein